MSGPNTSRSFPDSSSRVMDLHQLLRARLWVARLGERDVHSWWATDGILGPDGAFVGPRVLPRTHPTGRARIAFAVARHACDERHPDPSAHHLFHLSPEIEDAFDQLLVGMLGDADWWSAEVETLEDVTGDADSEEILRGAELITPDECDYVKSRDLGPAGRSLPLPRAGSQDVTIRRLTAGFIRSEPRELAVPYVSAVGE